MSCGDPLPPAGPRWWGAADTGTWCGQLPVGGRTGQQWWTGVHLQSQGGQEGVKREGEGRGGEASQSVLGSVLYCCTW